MANNSGHKQKSLKILMIHDSKIVRTIIGEYIRSDHPDAEMILTASSNDGARKMASEAFDIIFSGDEMAGMDGPALFHAMTHSKANPRTPFILMTATDTSENRRRLANAGIRHILPIPSTSTKFRKLIYRVFNPDANRDHIFYYLPSSKAFIGGGDHAVQMEIVNISRDSLVCETDRTAVSGNLEHAQTFELHFPADYGKASTIRIGGRLNRIKSITQNHFQPHEGYRVSWHITWEQFELAATTKTPLKLPFNGREHQHRQTGDAPPLPADNAAKIIQKNDRLKKSVRRLAGDKKSLRMKIKRLEQRIQRLETEIAHTPKRNVDLSALTAEPSPPSVNKAKMALFKRIIEDNIQIRNSENDN